MCGGVVVVEWFGAEPRQSISHAGEGKKEQHPVIHALMRAATQSVDRLSSSIKNQRCITTGDRWRNNTNTSSLKFERLVTETMERTWVTNSPYLPERETGTTNAQVSREVGLHHVLRLGQHMEFGSRGHTYENSSTQTTQRSSATMTTTIIAKVTSEQPSETLHDGQRPFLRGPRRAARQWRSAWTRR